LDEDGPAHIRGADVGGKIIDLRGPYLISGNWWDEKSWAQPSGICNWTLENWFDVTDRITAR